MPTHIQRLARALALAVAASCALPAQDGKQLFQMFCATCHMQDRMHVGPSTIEIGGLYRGKGKEFLAWCKNPQQKRKGVIQMPAMSFVSDKQLTAIHGYIVKSTKGKKEVVVKGGDKFRASPSMRRRPLVQRIFMPQAGPAAIAVAIDDLHHFCWDAGACRLRYVWQGDFIDGWPVWRANGDGLAKVLGDVRLRETRSPLPVAKDAKRKFLGYRMKDGLPTFRYRLADIEVEERFTLRKDKNALVRHFALRGAPADCVLTFTASDHISYRSTDGTFDGMVFTPAKNKASAFTVVMEFNK